MIDGFDIFLLDNVRIYCKDKITVRNFQLQNRFFCIEWYQQKILYSGREW